MFKLKQVVGAAALAASLAFGLALPAAAAPTITFGPAVDDGAGGVFVEVVVGDLGNEIVAAYDLDVGYDANALTFVDLTFSLMLGDGSVLDGDGLATEVFNLGPFDDGSLVDFAASSLLSDDALFALQGGGPVTLATLQFTGTDVSSLAFINWGDYNDVKGRRNQVIIPAGAIPEPATYALVGIALAGMLAPAALRRRRQAATVA